MLLAYYHKNLIEAGCDEAGRGCLAGPVVAAAVILPKDYKNPLLNDSKKCNEKLRTQLRMQIEQDALAYAVFEVDNNTIDSINILNASILAMHGALEKLDKKFAHILVDGNRFKNFQNITYTTVVGGDAKYASIAAASILAKTQRDKIMEELHEKYPVYNWQKNKGYPTAEHRKATIEHGETPYHRKSFHLKQRQLSLF